MGSKQGITESIKVTVVTSYYPPDYTSLSNYYKDTVYDLAEYGADVTLVCGIPTRLVDEETTKRYAMNPVEVVNDNLRIIRTGPKRPEGKSLISRAIYHVYRSLCIYNKAKKIETDVYFICSAPPFLGFFGTFLSKRAKTIYNLHDAFPDSLVNTGKVRESNLVVRLLRKTEKYVYKHNTHIRVISGDVANTIMQRGVTKEKITIIHDWVDENTIKYIDRKDNPLFDMLLIPREGFYVGYAGNIGLLQNLSTVIKAAEILEKREPLIQFLIIGDGAWKREMFNMLQEKELTNVLTFPMQDLKYVPYVYNLADVGVASIASGVSKGSLPSKTWNILSSSRPIICEVDEGSELAQIITDNKCGICITPGDAEGFANAVMALYNDRELSDSMGRNGRKFIEANNTRKKATKNIYECIMSVYNKK